VNISLTFGDPHVTVRIVDDGQSPMPVLSHGTPSPRPGAHLGGHGVLGMKERAAAFEGNLTSGPNDAGGWEVVATLRSCKAPIIA
jgi:signal transduction histidine kinase